MTRQETEPLMKLMRTGSSLTSPPSSLSMIHTTHQQCPQITVLKLLACQCKSSLTIYSFHYRFCAELKQHTNFLLFVGILQWKESLLHNCCRQKHLEKYFVNDLCTVFWSQSSVWLYWYTKHLWLTDIHPFSIQVVLKINQLRFLHDFLQTLSHGFHMGWSCSID